MTFEKVKNLVEKKGMSIRELERQAGLSNGAISKWKKSNPNVDSLKSVATVLEVKVDELLEE